MCQSMDPTISTAPSVERGTPQWARIQQVLGSSFGPGALAFPGYPIEIPGLCLELCYDCFLLHPLNAVQTEPRVFCFWIADDVLYVV
jgi:hypothetical protein